MASHDGGATWGSAVAVSSVPASDGFTFNLGVYADGTDVHVVWTDDRNSSDNRDVFYRKSTDGGATFGPELQLDSSGPGIGSVAVEVVIDGSGSTIAVGWRSSGASLPGRRSACRPMAA